MIDNQDAVLVELTRALVERFAPARIVLFGSRARGDHHPESDYDLMLVVEGESPPSADVVRRAVRDVQADIDVVVDTGERFERRRTDVGTLEYAADHEGRVLHTRATTPDARRVREPPSGSPESLQEWIGRAQSDFLAMTELARSGAAGIRDVVVFHAHQSVEKTLKAILVDGHVPPPRTHDLTALLTRLPDALRHDTLLDEACRGLQSLWPSSRYPSIPMPTSDQVDQALRWARLARQIANSVIAI